MSMGKSILGPMTSLTDTEVLVPPFGHNENVFQRPANFLGACQENWSYSPTSVDELFCKFGLTNSPAVFSGLASGANYFIDFKMVVLLPLRNKTLFHCVRTAGMWQKQLNFT